MSVLKSQIATEQLNLVPGRTMVVEDPDAFPDSFLDGLDCLSQAMSRARDEAAVMQAIQNDPPDVILLPHDLGLLDRIRSSGCQSGVVMVVPPEQVDDGARALELGAESYLILPLSLEQVVATLTLVATIRRLNRENNRYLSQMNELRTGNSLIGCCPASRRLKTILARAAESSVTVLIEGPPGAGKSLAAQIIHTSSRLSGKRLEVAYGDVLNPERIDQILHDHRVGTLLIENVDQLLSQVQSRVVRHIKEHSSNDPDRSGVRIIATTSVHLPELVARGRFREDLYYRLNVFPITIPSLRERRENIANLATHFMKLAAERTGEDSPAGITEGAMAMLEGHNWPGNVAQLQDVVVRAHALARGAPIDRKHLHGVTTGLTVDITRDHSAGTAPTPQSGPLTEEDILPLEVEEKRLLARALKATKGNVRRAAMLLRIGRATLYRKIQVYRLKLN